MAVPVTLTPAQERALDWLPGDGGWRSEEEDEGAEHVKGLCQLWVKFQIAEAQDAPVDEPWHWRLTPAGLALKAERRGGG